MAEQTQEIRETVIEQDGVLSRNQVVTNSDTTNKGRTIEQVIYFILTVVEILLGIRVFLSLLGANQGNTFAHIVYAISYPFVAPFFGLFGYTFRAGVSRLEIETLVAMAVYALVTYLIVKLTRIGRTT